MSHGLLAVLALTTALTHVVIAGHYVATPWKAAFRIGLSAVVVGLLVWTPVVNPLLILRRPYVSTAVERRRGDAWSVRMAPDGHEGLRFEAVRLAHGARHALPVGGASVLTPPVSAISARWR